jgi:lipid II:glycine glycyltransferase (peptidoglycan interpeptide bridge formation enzyme)
MKLVKINKEQLDNFVSKQKHSQFLQSYEWGEFQGNVLRYGLEVNDEIIFALSLFEKKLPIGKRYFYSPRIGIKFLNEEQLEFLFQELRSLLKKEKAVFWRFEPRSQLKIKNDKVNCEIREGGLDQKLIIKKTIDVQASQTSILDISRSEEEILKNMHQKTRYNIRLASRKGVNVRLGAKKDFDKFWEIMNETKDRDGFRLHAREYYRKMLEIDFIELIIAEFNGKIIAGNIVSYFGDMASYLHGSSSNKERNVMAPFAIQWFSILRAKEKACQYYDFNGIDEVKWPGVTRFKRGFSGADVIYPGTYDLLINKQGYIIYKLMRKTRRILGRVLKI